MPTVYQFLQNPEIFPYETTLSANPQILNCLIDYISKNPDPLIHNQQQCYVYPNKSAQILSLGTTYRTLIVKKQRKNKKTNEQQNYYPFLDRLFKNLQTATRLQETLLGYINKVLVSLAKKTPEIYQYIKDNQDIIGTVVKNNLYLMHFKQFWVTFLIESTMSLYVFLKNIVIRALMFRIIDEKDLDNIVVYEALLSIYFEISKKLKSKVLPEDEKEQLQQICVNFHDQDFMTLLVLKISSKNSQKTYFIGKLLNEMLNFPQTKVFTEFSMSHMEAIEQYFEFYEDSSNFMDFIHSDQIQILKMLLSLCEKGLLQHEYEINLMKRLLVYTSIHKKNSILHNILIKLIQVLTENQKTSIFKEMNVIAFFIKNSESKDCRYAYGSLIWKICSYWYQNDSKLGKYLEQEQKKFVLDKSTQKSKKFQNLKQYKLLQNKSQILTEQSSELLPEKPKQEPPLQPQPEPTKQ